MVDLHIGRLREARRRAASLWAVTNRRSYQLKRESAGDVLTPTHSNTAGR